MSQKRKHAETRDESSAAPKPTKKPRAFKPAAQGHPKPKKRPHVSNDTDKTASTSALKSRIRDLKRLLAHVDTVPDHKMSAGKRIERERELAAIEHELREKMASSREAAYKRKMIGKYHQVRFFDRQKGTRILRRLRKELAVEQVDASKEDLRKRVHNAEVDVNYAVYYPLLKPYASLYPKSRKDRTDESDQGDEEDTSESAIREVDGPKGDVDMWKTVEEAMAQGTLQALRDRKDDMPAAVPKKEKKNKEGVVKSRESKIYDKLAEAKNRRERRALGVQAQEEAEESDGGFFE
ncbi:hypothetical protein BDW02DRAFT_573506 [Decorospora gaudefroyi]|uniref:rRNA-processing protein EFG1 n=1 Tax=Decorospora gaudefroyi TaxID=184978 RepID=A0A6A5JYB7_9PLEO|nr:hypothetical protein BDW02DRAFT_573506 [Decorospora gaudefroyi]